MMEITIKGQIRLMILWIMRKRIMILLKIFTNIVVFLTNMVPKNRDFLTILITHTLGLPQMLTLGSKLM